MKVRTRRFFSYFKQEVTLSIIEALIEIIMILEKFSHEYSMMNILWQPKFMMMSISNNLQAKMMPSRHVRTSM
jgi:hypothetical protein